MDVQGKVWGSTSLLFLNNNVELHRLVGRRGGYSSKHHHVKKWNKFMVERGKILVRRWKGYGLVDETVLGSHQSCIIPPGEDHQFEVLEDDSVIYELYWTQLEPDDIVRNGHGGCHAEESNVSTDIFSTSGDRKETQ